MLIKVYVFKELNKKLCNGVPTVMHSKVSKIDLEDAVFLKASSVGTTLFWPDNAPKLLQENPT